MSLAPRTAAPAASDVEAWLAELGLVPLERADREGVTSWDLVLDGRRRAALRVTLILDPALACICWAHFAPPISDGFRRSYRLLLRWNDELPFVKFSVGEDERPLLTAELPAAGLDRDVLGLAIARLLAVADRLHAQAVPWLKAGGWSTDAAPAAARGAGVRLLDRYADPLAELLAPPDGADDALAADGRSGDVLSDDALSDDAPDTAGGAAADAADDAQSDDAPDPADAADEADPVAVAAPAEVRA